MVMVLNQWGLNHCLERGNIFIKLEEKNGSNSTLDLINKVNEQTH